ncbi:MAG: FtsX-like permease family protein [Bacteroidia bacterium]|nr:FtsX-like permease family protein [Bacteroidia bacterium]
MNLSFYIAKRYLFSKKRTNLINIISAISVVGMAIGTMGLIIGLSGFNGFDSLIKSLFSSFDPDLKITLVEGKSFDANNQAFNEIRQMKDVLFFTEVVEDNALLRYENRQVLATIKGVSDDYSQMTGLDTMIVDGEFILNEGDNQYAVIGQGVAYYLSVGLKLINPINIYVPQKGRSTGMAIEGSFNQGHIYPSGVFSVQQDIDSKYIIVPIAFAREIFEIPEKVNSVELKLKEGATVKTVQKTISTQLGNRFTVKTRYQQHDYLYKTMQGEKYAVYLILILILIIASFNIVGSLTMLIIDKKEDITILQSMGADKRLIRNIFLFEGWSVSILGAIIGTVAGIAICQAQITFGFVKLQGGGGSFIIDAYPMKIIPLDILLIFCSVVLIGFLAAWFPVKYISGKSPEDEAH